MKARRISRRGKARPVTGVVRQRSAPYFSRPHPGAEFGAGCRVETRYECQYSGPTAGRRAAGVGGGRPGPGRWRSRRTGYEQNLRGRRGRSSSRSTTHSIFLSRGTLGVRILMPLVRWTSCPRKTRVNRYAGRSSAPVVQRAAHRSPEHHRRGRAGTLGAATAVRTGAAGGGAGPWWYGAGCSSSTLPHKSSLIFFLEPFVKTAEQGVQGGHRELFAIRVVRRCVRDRVPVERAVADTRVLERRGQRSPRGPSRP